MTTMRWFRAGATPRGTPAFRRSLRRHPVVIIAMFAAFVQTGCQSGPLGCGSCGGFGNRIRATSDRIFSPVRNAFRPVVVGAPSGGCCGSTLPADSGQITYGSSEVIVPGQTVIGPAPTTSSPTLSPLPPPSNSSVSPDLEPIPSSSPGPAPPAGDPQSQGAKASDKKTNYEAFRYKAGQGQTPSGALAKSAGSSSEPTNRSAQGPKSPPAPDSADNDPLDNLPAIAIPADLTRSNPEPTTSDPKSAAGGISPLAVKAAEGLPPGANVAPGIRRFSGVESKLAGGSLPDVSGLDWLVDKGYKTLLDLRENADLSPTFLNEVSKRGLRYVALPISLKTIDQEHVSRFKSEVSFTEGRPLFFCDADGTRAGVMWYIHRVTVDKIDPMIARRDGEELGLSDPKFWQAAEDYLDSLKGNAAPAPALTPVETIKKLDAPPVPAPGPTTDQNAPSAPNAGPSPTSL